MIEEFLRDLPGWMRPDHWQKLMRAIFGYIIQKVGYIRAARLAAMPGQIDDATLGGFPNTDALSEVGRDRKIRRGKLETDWDYAARLRDWHAAWRLAGTYTGLLMGIRAMMTPSPPSVTIVRGNQTNVKGYWWTLDDTGVRYQNSDGNGVFWPADGSDPEPDATVVREWDWDSNYWPSGFPGPTVNPDPSRLWVIFGGTLPPEIDQIEGNWGDGLSVYGETDPTGASDKMSIGTTATRSYVESIRSIAKELSPGGVLIDHIILAYEAIDNTEVAAPGSGTLPDGWWKWHGKIIDDGGTWRRVRARTAANRYWKGTV